MKYKLLKAESQDIDILKKYKGKTIFEYIDNINENEKIKIQDYIKNNIEKNLNAYQIIMVDNKKVGCLLLYSYEDGILLDEIYLEEKYRNKGIGTDIINKIIANNDIIYLWVYKKNKKAVNLYKKLGFKVIESTKERYFMKNIKKDQLLFNLDKIHTTQLGIERIKRNLGLEVADVVVWCIDKIKDCNSKITRKGKNWYISIDNFIITVNAYSYTIITAHKMREENVKNI